MVNKGRSHQGAKMGRGTDQAFQELSPHVLQTIGHRCERDRLSSFWCVFHVHDLPAERQRQGPKLKAEVDAGPRCWAQRREEAGRGLEAETRQGVGGGSFDHPGAPPSLCLGATEEGAPSCTHF